MNDPLNKQMEQFRNKDDGNLHLYQDPKGQMFYMIEKIDDDTAIFTSAEVPEGQAPQKMIKGLFVMHEVNTLPFEEYANSTKAESTQPDTPTTKPAKGKWEGWGCAVIMLLVIFAIIFLTVQGSKHKKQQQPTKDTEQVIQLHNNWKDLAWKDYNRVIALLSFKYSISDSIVKVMILEYLRINEPTKYSPLTMYDTNRDTTIFNYLSKPKESINVTIQRLNRQYVISSDTISSLLLDFEIWLQTKEK